MTATLLRVRDLRIEYRARGARPFGHRRWAAVDGVDLDICEHETVGLVGESGCGKSTFARSLVGLEPAAAGTIELGGRDLARCRGAALRRLRRDVALLFQDPSASLNPRLTVERTVSEPLHIHGEASRRTTRDQVREMLELVGLSEAFLARYPHELSGGQRQRVGLARALILRPVLLILDEPVSALDVSIQAQIIEVLSRAQEELGVAMLFISHDLAVVRSVAQRVAVMYLGRIVEEGPRAEVYARPAHPYTRALLSAVPSVDRVGHTERIVLDGEVPDPSEPPTGCRFRTRCWKAEDVCATDPTLTTVGARGHRAACHLPELDHARAVSGSDRVGPTDAPGGR